MIQRGNLASQPQTQFFSKQPRNLDLIDIDILIIAHPDEYMVQRIRSSFSDQSMVITSNPQFTWDFSKDSLVDWESENYQFKTIVLIGSSQGGTPQRSVQVFNAKKNRDVREPGKSNPLFQRAQQAISLVKQSESHFVDQLDLLVEHPEIQQMASRRPVAVEGLFYRAESGLFCRFDRDSREFQPLLEEVA